MNKAILPNGCVVLNYSNAKTKLPSVDEVPTLSNLENLPVFMDDDNPYYKLEAIEFPVEGTGGIYTKKFFQSFINKLKNRVYSGSKRGHEFLSRPNTDFYTVGGMVQENADGETGTAFLKMYIPPKLDSDNYGFINDCKAGIVHFSLVTLPKHIIKKDANGIEKKYFVSSEGYERNDAVEYGAGAMAQVVNEKQYNPYPNYHAARIVEPSEFQEDSFRYVIIDKEGGIDTVMGKLKGKTEMTIQAYRFKKEKWTEDEAKKWLKDHKIKYISFEKASSENKNEEIEELKTLILTGLYDTKKNTDGDIIQSGLVMRSVLRRKVSNANDENKTAYAELISLIDIKENERRKTVDKKELFETLANLYKNGQTNAAEIAEAIGFSDKIRTDEDVKNTQVVSELKKNYGDEFQKTIEDVKKENEINSELAVINAIVPVVGSEKIKNEDGTEDENPAYIRAFEICKSKKGEELKEAVKNLGDDVILKAIRKNQASIDSGITAIKSVSANSELKEY